jgi:cold shock protein
MATGTVKWFDPQKGFGFILNQSGEDVFVHYTSIDGDGFRCLRNGQVVEYQEMQTGKGLQGKQVRLIQAGFHEKLDSDEIEQAAF